MAAPFGSLEYWIVEQITGKYLDTSAHKWAFSQLFHTGIQYLIKPWAENSSSELKKHYIKDSAGFWLQKGKRMLYQANVSSLLLGVGLLGLPYLLSPLKFPMSPLYLCKNSADTTVTVSSSLKSKTLLHFFKKFYEV